MFKVLYKLVVDIKFRVCHEFYEKSGRFVRKKMELEGIEDFRKGFWKFHFSSQYKVPLI